MMTFSFKALQNTLSKAFDTPLGRPARKLLITLLGIFVILLGLILIILPGPAIVFIPIGLAILALEYPIARRWLRWFQKQLSAVAKKADAKVAAYRNRR